MKRRFLHFVLYPDHASSRMRPVSQVFENVVKDLLVNNGHRATVESVPNTELEAQIDGKEKGLLDDIKKSMSDQVTMIRAILSKSRSFIFIFSSTGQPDNERPRYCRHSSFLKLPVFLFFPVAVPCSRGQVVS